MEAAERIVAKSNQRVSRLVLQRGAPVGSVFKVGFPVKKKLFIVSGPTRVHQKLYKLTRSSNIALTIEVFMT